MIKGICLFYLGFFGVLPFLAAQTPVSYTSSELFLRLNKLRVLGSVLYIAAHPDDENSRLIAFLAKERLYRTGYLSMTRGDGGQNLIGDEQGEELGLIRTQEMLAARRIDGAEQFFTRAFDFGFTKTTEEALKTWNKEKILADVVWVIRKFQPDVLITRFPEDSRAGHGHHSASSVIAHEAFSAAADPNRFPEQFKYGVKPWQAKRLLWNTFNFGGANTTSDDQMKIDVGVYNAILGKSYGEIAAESRTQHKSQGAALTPARGQSLEYFTTIAGEAAHTDPMEGIITDWTRIEGGDKIQSLIDLVIKNYSLANPENSVPGLVNLYTEIGKLKNGYWKTQKLAETQILIEACAGLWLEATVHNGYTVRGDKLNISIVVNNRNGVDAELDGIRLESSTVTSQRNYFDAVPHDKVFWLQPQLDSSFKTTLTKNKNYVLNESFVIGDNEPITQPYWLAESMSAGSYNVGDQLLIGNPQSPPAFQAYFKVLIGGQLFSFARPVQYKFTDPVKGELYEPLTVLPAYTGNFEPDLLLFTDGEDKKFEVLTKKHSGNDLNPNLSLSQTADLTVKKAAELYNDQFLYTAKPLKNEPATDYAYLLADREGKQDSIEQLISIAYDHIPRIDYFRKAREKFVLSDVRIAGKHIGYIEGVGDKVPQALLQMGYDVVMLGEKDITGPNLSQFDAVITGIRAYDVHEWLSGKYTVLMNYINEGGNLIVQYNRNNNIGNTKIKIGPYPFTISNGRVTDENAKVNFLIPEHPVLNFPNKISEKDFEGWIQERGIYFINQLDSKYESILSMHDPGEAEQNGSLVVADYGKGKFVYTGLVFFRQLPAGVAGAYRLLANIIALNRKKGF
jgi:LmbE family N-acetylglucosaminyl deacetylase